MKAAGLVGKVLLAFGSRYQLKMRVRRADEKPDAPDPYIVSLGLMKAREDSGNPPVRALTAFPH